jgi:hypothetical protein
MYLRIKIAKGNEYVQVVEGKRDPATRKVRQRVVVSLGVHSNPASCLEAKKRERSELKQAWTPILARYAKWGDDKLNATEKREQASMLAKLAKLDRDIAVLADIVKNNRVGTTHRPNKP